MQHSGPSARPPFMAAAGRRLLVAVLCCVPATVWTPARANGPIFTRDGGVSAPGASPGYSVSGSGAASFRSIQAQSLRGDVSQATIAGPANTTQGVARTLSARAADMQFAGDFGVNGSGTAAIILRAQAAGDTSAMLPNTTAVVAGHLLTASALPIGTTIASVAAPATLSASYPTSAATPLRSMASMGTALVFASAFAVPAGATVAGAGIAAGATAVGCVSSGGVTTVYMSLPAASAIAQGTVVTFGFQSVAVTLSAGWTQAAAPATPVGLPAEDDALAFQNATFFANVHNGGSGLLYIPSGNYYASTVSGGADGVSVEAAANVVLLPGSQPIGNLRGYSAGTAAKTFASSAQNSLPSGLNVNQTIYQQAMPTSQAQALLLNQHNINCIDDGGPHGCGMVGAEIQQDVEPSVLAGIMWGYHATDYIYQGQSAVSWVGQELELNDNSGTDKPMPGGSVVSYGVHLDLLGPSNGTAGIYFGASGAGRWHYGLACPQNAILNDCWSVHSGTGATVIAGVDMSGNLLAQTVRAAGSIISAQSGAYTLAASDCGTTIRDTGTTAHSYVVPGGLPVGCRLDIIQAAGGAVTIGAGAGETLEAFNGATRTAGQYAKAQVLVDSAASFLLSGQVQ